MSLNNCTLFFCRLPMKCFNESVQVQDYDILLSSKCQLVSFSRGKILTQTQCAGSQRMILTRSQKTETFYINSTSERQCSNVHNIISYWCYFKISCRMISLATRDRKLTSVRVEIFLNSWTVAYLSKIVRWHPTHIFGSTVKHIEVLLRKLLQHLKLNMILNLNS